MQGLRWLAYNRYAIRTPHRSQSPARQSEPRQQSGAVTQEILRRCEQSRHGHQRI